MSAAAPGNFESQTKDGWFTELSTMWPGQGMSLKIDEVIFKGRSDFQVRSFTSSWNQSILHQLHRYARESIKLYNHIEKPYINVVPTLNMRSDLFCRMLPSSRLRLSAPFYCWMVLFSALTVMNSLTKK